MRKILIWWTNQPWYFKALGSVVVFVAGVLAGIAWIAKFVYDPEAVFARGMREAVDKTTADNQDVQDDGARKDAAIAQKIIEAEEETKSDVQKIDDCRGDIDCIDRVLYGRRSEGPRSR